MLGIGPTPQVLTDELTSVASEARNCANIISAIKVPDGSSPIETLTDLKTLEQHAEAAIAQVRFL